MENKELIFKLVCSGIYEIWISRDKKYKEGKFVGADVIIQLLNEEREISILDGNNDRIY
jgi:hypothetical protein